MVMSRIGAGFKPFFLPHRFLGAFFPNFRGGGWSAQTPDSYSDNFSKPPIGLAKTTTAWYNISEGIFTEVRLEAIIAF